MKYQLARTTQNGFVLDISDRQAFSEMLAHDASRFSSASFETLKILSFPNNLPRSLGWVAVEVYYSAFFAAHSIFRIFGNVFSYLAGGHLKIVEGVADILNMPWFIGRSAGSFIGVSVNQNSSIELKKAGSSHEDFWQAFVGFVDSFRDRILNVQGLGYLKQELIDEFSSIYSLLTKSGYRGGGSWLSHFRNNINYQHSDGLWYPYSNGQHDVEKFKRILSLWDVRDRSLISSVYCNSGIELFFKGCVSIINLCYLIVCDIEAFSKLKNNCFSLVPSQMLKKAI
ncbi:hypothetical protein [Salinicola aestuarinus]|uniref:hypothetical protein n=1 Tax=Salinicola aestuarinus TaxID=1949082 RepID=UPI00130075CE|nr:hypothetical protein [Salinicola aestuarinus]